MVRISASFGSDIWEAKNFGQVMYAIRTRNGDVYLELESRCASALAHMQSTHYVVPGMHIAKSPGHVQLVCALPPVSAETRD